MTRMGARIANSTATAPRSDALGISEWPFVVVSGLTGVTAQGVGGGKILHQPLGRMTQVQRRAAVAPVGTQVLPAMLH